MAPRLRAFGKYEVFGMKAALGQKCEYFCLEGWS